ncbi:MAG: hypothetical protein IJG97_02400 [Bacilli bacterium]|nr:hypothetical protein [Bacilli bacterium]
MAIINQENLNSLMASFNSSLINIQTTIQNGNTTFGQDLAAVWESKTAQETAGKIDEAINGLWTAYKTCLSDLWDGIKTNVDNYNKFNKGEVVLQKINDMAGDVSKIQEYIKNKFGDGDEGLKDGKSAADAGKVLDRIVTDVESEINSSAASISGCGAFDADETKAVSDAIKACVLVLKGKMGEIATEVGTTLTTVDTQAAQLKSTNIGNMSIGS